MTEQEQRDPGNEEEQLTQLLEAQQRARAEAQDALEFVQDIIGTLREPFLIMDESLRVLEANESFYERFQVTREETVDRRIYELGNGQWDIPQLREALHLVMTQRQHLTDFEVTHEFPNIGRRVMLLNARRIRRDHLPEPRDRILLAIEDVTERRQAEERMAASELHYRRLFETARDAILILDGDTGKIIDANSFMSELTGYDQDYFLGKELWQIGLFEDIEASQRAFQELQREEYIRYQHLPLRTRDGRQVEVEFISNVYQVDGQRITQCNIRDVTERQRMEREIQQQAHELVDLDRRKDEFLAMLSHELRNPLAPIANALQLLRLGQGDASIQQEALDTLDRQVATIARLVDDLLDVSRVTTGRIQLQQTDVDLNALVRGAADPFRTQMAERQQEFSVSLSGTPLWVHGDPTRLEQVVVNLLSNSLKYTPEGGQVWLTVVEEGNEAVIRVRDSGKGIEASLLPHIFELFSQGERGLDRQQGGLGIGLPLVKSLVEMHGGTVTAQSEGHSRGSEFVVRLPATSSPVPQAVASLEVTTEPAARSLRVLLVDDVADTRIVFGRLLEILGHQVRTAGDGPSALEAALEFRPDMVLLDIGLPGMDGYEVVQRMRQEPALQNVVLVAVTGYGQQSDRQRSEEAGFEHHLVKPPDIDTLQQLLAAIAERGT
jgi:PAS domain S-box-containing protein